MTDPEPLPRPRQVVVAGVLGLFGSLLLLVVLFDAMGRVHSSQMRAQVRSMLSQPPGDGLGMTVEQVLDIVRGVVLFDGALAAAAVVLAGFALTRHNGARIGFTVVAAVLLVTGPVAGSVVPVIDAVAAALLWARPSRDWFAGRAAAPAQPLGERTPTESEQRPEPERPRPAPAAQPWASWPPPAAPFPPPAAPGPRPSHSGSRPGSVTAAAVLTWVSAGVTALAYVAVVMVIMLDREELIQTLQRNPSYAQLDIAADDLIAALWVISALAILWCLFAIVLAFLSVRGLRWSRAALVISSAVAIPVSLFAFPVGLINVAAAAVTIKLLVTRSASDWFDWNAGHPGTVPTTRPPRPPRNVW
ncbi:MAG TPA: hypothetical protein VFJ19_05105 [Nocardioidaceae bacterium]|nr:hypothetical protein [Nocardioidaceae bacterium]